MLTYRGAVMLIQPSVSTLTWAVPNLKCLSNEGDQGARTLQSKNPDEGAAPPVEPDLPTWKPGQKRTFPEDFKRRAVAYYDSLPEDGSKGSYLRRAGIYSSSISQWRRVMQSGSSPTVGRKPTDPIVKKNAELSARVAKLEAELARANMVIEVQKKVSALLESISEQAS
jgi:transposase